MPEHDLIAAAASAAVPGERLPHFVFHGSQYWSPMQVLEAFTELHYAKINNFVPGKGKKVASRVTTLTLVNANSLGGIAHFFEQLAQKISNTAVSFLEAQPPKTISPDTLRKMWEKKVAFRVSQRLSWGKGPNAFFRTGDGDFPNVDENHSSLSHLPERERFQVAYTCAQIDDLLDSYLQSVGEEEIRHRERATASHHAAAVVSSRGAPSAPENNLSGSALENLDASALAMIVRPPNQHAFGQPLLPAAPEGAVAGASTKPRGAQTGIALKKRRDDDSSSVQKVLDFGSSVTSLGSAMMERMKRPSLEEDVAKYSAVSQAVVKVVSTAVVDAVKEWRKPVEIPTPKPSALLRMNPRQLFQSIKDIGAFFGDYPELERNIIGAGLDGPMIARMSDGDVKDFLVSDCKLKTVHANMLIAKVGFWRDSP
jgi:hypothetical protein